MPLQPLDEWKTRWSSADAQRLGVRPDAVDAESAHFIIDRPYGDNRDHDPLSTNVALSYALDVAALSAVIAHLDDEREQPNGTASLHVNYLSEPQGTIRASARVLHWAPYGSLLELQARDERGVLVAHGVTSYSLRPRTNGTSV